MSGWRAGEKGRDVVRKNKIIVPGSVENKEELMLFVVVTNPFQAFVSEPTNSFEFVFDQKAGVNCDSQG